MGITGDVEKMNRLRKIERVAAYIRVSTQEQKMHGFSLDAQKMKLIAYAKKHGLKIVEWYTDEGVSGRKIIRKRPELQRMIEDAEAGKFDRIIFIKLDRFFRSVAEYHECMKRITPVVWTATEEDYDLSTSNGRMLVNMRLAIAEQEADTKSERIRIVNDYKVTTGQPLVGDQCLPFGFQVGRDTSTGRKSVVKNPQEAPIVEEIISLYLAHTPKRRILIYLNTKHGVVMKQPSLTNLLTNTMLYGEYRGNPNYCEAYIDKDTFEKMQRSTPLKENTAERAYLFSGLLLCPECSRNLKGGIHWCTNKYGKRYRYKKYRCQGNVANASCSFNKCIHENTIEKMLLANIDKYLADAKLSSVSVSDGNGTKIPKYDIEAINAEIDRLNYSWQQGRIRTVEQYDKEYDALLEKLEKAKAEKGVVEVKDFSKIETILSSGWREIYNSLEDEYKRAFWRSFIESIELNWTTDKKEIAKVNFF